MNMSQTILRKLPAQSPWISLLMQKPVSTSLLRRKTTKGPTDTSSSSDSDDNIKEAPKIQAEAITRLNTLLQQMTSENYPKKMELAQPTNKRTQGRKEKESVTKQSVDTQVVNAVKGVAESLGGDTKQTESELLMKLLNPVERKSEKEDSLSEILKGMKIEREVKPQQSRAEQIRSAFKRFERPITNFERPAEQRKSRQSSAIIPKQIQPEPMDLFLGESLGIFTNSEELKESPQLPTWQKLHEKELKLAVTHPPANYFQEMILWTEQGKFWQFPINNEFGLEEESNVYFTEHVFLEEHLEPWCPPRGPIRHFMDLVCVGLSKNSYLTIQAKKEHIEWFRNYFEDKKELLQEVGALSGGDAKAPNVEVEK